MNNNLKNYIDNNLELINLKINKLENKFKTIEKLFLNNINEIKKNNDEKHILNNKLDYLENKIKKLENKINSINENINDESNIDININDMNNINIDNIDNLKNIKQMLKFVINLQDDMKDRMDILDLQVNNISNDLKNHSYTEDNFISALE